MGERAQGTLPASTLPGVVLGPGRCVRDSQDFAAEWAEVAVIIMNGGNKEQ